MGVSLVLSGVMFFVRLLNYISNAMTSKKSKFKVLHLWDAVYLTNLYVCYGWPKKNFTEALKNNDVECYTKLRQGIAILDNDDNVWIWTLKKDIPNLVHEAVHAAEYVLLDRGLEFRDETSEAFAYYVAMVVRETLRKR